MYKRLFILSLIIITALCGLSGLGYHSIRIWAQGLEGRRIGEFAEVAEQIRQDVKRKLDEFMEQEQNRPYTDYQYYFVPDNFVAEQSSMNPTLLRSPLAGQLEHGLAYYNFQIQPDGSISTPNIYIEQQQTEVIPEDEQKLLAEVNANNENVENNLLPALGRVAFESPEPGRSILPDMLATVAKEQKQTNIGKGAKSISNKANYAIESLQQRSEQAQVYRQSRALVASNTSIGIAEQEADLARVQQGNEQQQPAPLQQQSPRYRNQAFQAEQTVAPPSLQAVEMQMTQQSQADTVEIRIEPFVPVVVPDKKLGDSIFAGQVFMLRRVQIEDKNFLQGFQLNERQLREEVKNSARRFVREDMNFNLIKAQSESAEPVAYTAVLDFVGLGHLILNLVETNPARIAEQISHLQNMYFGIISVVFFAVTLAVGSLWLNARAQINLAQKKDDFVSAVSHELRTPLTSIRMYAEMLEKNWVKSEDKLAEYYRNMRQESERLSRLIENVLDFSRIQRGRKKYAFNLGDINKCIADVVEVMAPYAAQKGFTINTELSQLGEMAFDNDAVKQIVVNLLDNAIKYSRDAKDKTITVRTVDSGKFTLIEIGDHGPGIPHRQQRKIFEQFYRVGAEATRETAGSGLGLALVKKFAQAHEGFVEIVNAKPTGAIFRVALAHITSG